MKPIIIILAAIATIATITAIIVTLNSSQREHLYFPHYSQFDFITNSSYCKDCKMDIKNCYKCTNCGVCVKENGTAECVPGDERGPLYRKDCQIWNPYQNDLPSSSPYNFLNFFYDNIDIAFSNDYSTLQLRDNYFNPPRPSGGFYTDKWDAFKTYKDHSHHYRQPLPTGYLP